MPYGNTSRSSQRSEGIQFQTYKKDSPSSAYYLYTFSTPFPPEPITLDYCVRSGGNTSPAVLRAASSLDGKMARYSIVSKTIYTGPRLAYQIVSPKTGQLIWVRQPIQVFRFIPVRKRIKSVAKGLDLPPQPLNYSSFSITHHPPAANFSVYRKTSNGYEEYRYDYVGCLWKAWTPILGAQLPYSHAIFQNSTVSSAITDMTASADSIALSRLYEKAKNQKINLGQVFAERAQTARMFSDVITRLAQGIRLMQKGNLVGAAKKLFPSSSKALANEVLLIQYGIRPLIGDIQGAAEHLAVPEEFQFDIKVSCKKELPRQVNIGQHSDSCPGESTLIRTGFTTVTYKIRVKVASKDIREADRLGLTNLNSVAWEVTPWSFIVDWAFPIGNYLNNRDAFDHLTFVHGHKTVFSKEFCSMSRRFGGTRTSYSDTFRATDLQLEPITVEKVSCVRSILSTFPPIPRPSLKDPFSGQHVLNALALLRQLKR